MLNFISVLYLCIYFNTNTLHMKIKNRFFKASIGLKKFVHNTKIIIINFKGTK